MLPIIAFNNFIDEFENIKIHDKFSITRKKTELRKLLREAKNQIGNLSFEFAKLIIGRLNCISNIYCLKYSPEIGKNNLLSYLTFLENIGIIITLKKTYKNDNEAIDEINIIIKFYYKIIKNLLDCLRRAIKNLPNENQIGIGEIINVTHDVYKEDMKRVLEYLVNFKSITKVNEKEFAAYVFIIYKTGWMPYVKIFEKCKKQFSNAFGRKASTYKKKQIETLAYDIYEHDKKLRSLLPFIISSVNRI